MIRAEVHTTAVPPDVKGEPKAIPQPVPHISGPTNEPIDPRTTATREDYGHLPSIETKVNVEDIEDSSTAFAADSSASVSASPEESAENVDSIQMAPSLMLPSDCNSPHRETACLGVDKANDAADGAAQNANPTEGEKRLSTLKAVWGSQDDEDVAYLQVVL